MLLFYSGSVNPDNPSSPERSLGGYCSSTQVPNGSINNLFSTITRQVIKSNTRELRLIVLKNVSGQAVNNILIYTTTPVDSYEQLRLAAVSPAYDQQCNKFFFEQLQSSDQLPYQATLNSHEGVGAAISANVVLEPGKLIGIWVERTFKQTTIDKFVTSTPQCSDKAIAALEQLQLPQSDDNLQLNIDYDFVPTTTTTTTII